MSEKIVSPDVVIKEEDNSVLPQSQEQPSSFTVISPAEKGEYFVPRKIFNMSTFNELFGENVESNYLGITVRNYLAESNTPVTVMAVANTETYTIDNYYKVVVSDMNATPIVNHTVALIQNAKGSNADLTLAGDGGTVNSFTINNVEYTLKYNFDNSLSEFNNPKSSSDDFYVCYLKDWSKIDDFLSIEDGDALTVTVEKIATPVNMGGYRNAETPWVVDSNNKKLFKLHTMQDGDLSNKSFKVEIDKSNYLDEDEYQSFDVNIRAYSDRDNQKQYKQKFLNVNLNKNSSDYIGQRIGNVREYYDYQKNALVEEGIYSNMSSIVRVELAEDEDYKSGQVVSGFRKYDLPHNDFDFEDHLYSNDGVDFDDHHSHYLHSRLTGESVESTEKVSCDDVFVFGFQKGSVGQDLTHPTNVGKNITTENCMGFNFIDVDANGFKSYKRALNILNDSDRYDFSLMAMPGLNCMEHESIINEAISFCENRGDVFLILDSAGEGSDEDQANIGASKYDTSYASSFYPFMIDRVNGNEKVVPQSCLIPAIFAYNDKVAHPWFAPLGYARGKYKGSSIRPLTWVKKNDRDKLVSGRVNPASNINGNLILLGNETLQIRDTLLKKINVRRLLIDAKKFINTVCWRYIGEPNTLEVRSELKAIINGYLTRVQESRGIQQFKVDFPASLNPESSTVIRGKILLRPTLATEAIEITVGVTDTGTDFDD